MALTPEVLKPVVLAELVGWLTFGARPTEVRPRASWDAKYDTVIRTRAGAELKVSEVQNTLFKEGRISRAISSVAAVSQGEVISFAAHAAEMMRSGGLSVIIEGRAQVSPSPPKRLVDSQSSFC